MALEASIIERLQELRKWQIDQEKRLLRQQQEQRQLLSIEQERMYEVLGASMKDVSIDKSIIDEMSASKLQEHVDALNDRHTNENKIEDESEDTPNISRQKIITSRENSHYSGDSDKQLNVHLDVPNVCLKAFDTDLTLSDSSSYPNLPQFNLHGQDENDAIYETPKRLFKNHFNMSIQGIEPLVSEELFNKNTVIDDIPVPSPKKDFKTLLEEKLRDETLNIHNKLEPKNQIKRPFLRKGEGLARFRLNSSANKVKKPNKSRNTSRFTSSPSDKSNKPSIKNVVEKPRVNSINKKVNDVSRRNMSIIPNVAQPKLMTSNAMPTKKAVRSSRSLPTSVRAINIPAKLHEITDKCISNDESNQSDLDLSKLETKMFEMLEEKAENSSFCSTSSAVVAFMQQSTPLKLKNIRKNLPAQRQKINRPLDRSNDNVLNEIVDTLNSNTIQESPQVKFRDTSTHKKMVMPKWDSGPFTNKNVPQIHARHIQQNMSKIVHPINKNNNNQYKINKIVKMNHGDAEDDVCNLSSSTEIESVNENSGRNSLSNSLSDENQKHAEKEIETNVNMHVRFSEYNEYKTIGLTDTSTLSTDSHSVINTTDREKNCSDDSENEESLDFTLPTDQKIIDQQHLMIDSSKKIVPPTNQCHYMNASKNCTMNEKMMIVTECHNSTENSNSNSIDQSSDEEHSMFNDSEGTYCDEDPTISGIQEAMSKILNDNNEGNNITPNLNTMKSSTQSQSSGTNTTIFKSELLTDRLLELEREIDIFRKENVTLSLQRKKIQDEYRQMQREFKEKEATLERERNQMNIGFQEEKKRLAREKSALENRLRDAREKSIQNKHERQEIQMLNEQLEELRDDMTKKESRWQAAQARQRSQIRVLQVENSKLKSEIERLQATKRVNGKLKRPNVISNTKIIHQINKQLDDKRGTVNNPATVSDGESETAKIMHQKKSGSPISSASTNHSVSSDVNTDKIIIYNSRNPSNPVMESTEGTVSKKRFLYDKLLKDATYGYPEHNYQKLNTNVNNTGDKSIVSSSNYEKKKDSDSIEMPTNRNSELATQRLSESAFHQQNVLPRVDDESEHEINAKVNSEKVEQIAPTCANHNLELQLMTRGSYQQFIREVINAKNKSAQLIKSNCNDVHNSLNVRDSYEQVNYSTNKVQLRTDEVQKFSCLNSMNKQQENNDGTVEKKNTQVESKKINYGQDRMKVNCSFDSDLTPRKEHKNPLPRPPDNMTPHPEPIQVSQISDSLNPNKVNSSPALKHNIREVKHLDGHIEYWYPNGNVKKIYPDRHITKMIYYNGDVRETTSDGCVKYFYAATKTWHTTYPDGFEILEFLDGQQERRTKDGVVEVSFSDGSVRLMQPDGIEKWALPDGTIAETFPNGEKILSLPNGQREIHTADHKRREYPDGTVKFVYPDGTQETRYANGRIRIKDKDGNLVMDSHQS